MPSSAGFGTFYIYKLLREGPAGAAEAIPNATASRPLAFADTAATATGGQRRSPEASMTDPSTLALFWAAVIAAAILIYVLLDGFDIGVGILFGTTRDEAKRGQMMNSIAPFWDGNETWLVVIGASLFAAFPAAYAVFLGAFYLPVLLMLVGLIFRGVAFEFRYRSVGMRRFWDAGFCLRLHAGRLRPGRGGRRDDARHSGREHAVRRRRLHLAASFPRPDRHRADARLRAARRLLDRLQDRGRAAGLGLRAHPLARRRRCSWCWASPSSPR